ncbi:electron transport complex subunit RsxG [Psychromonas ossibalaenae]|uniref:electron transport complex subunit RsxG n=1 Tax=Psychromonas ossibalaenae TaxID=444922 RepID=UPI0003619CF9|nr:electron transport complex subunit RsxG [Psychromonas ossibalaenae]
MFPTISRNALLLAAFAVVCTACIAVVSVLTKPVIAQQEQKALLKTLNQLIPEESYDNDIFATCFTVTDENLLGSKEPQQVFIAKKDQLPIAVFLEASTLRGYAGEIKILVGIYKDGEVAGVRVTRHTETPGLGDKVQLSKSNWINSFTGKFYHESEAQRWEVKKNNGDFDAFTGATITPRAVTLAVKDTLIYFQDNKQQLFSHPADCGEKQ